MAMTIAGYYIQEVLEKNIDAMERKEFETDPQEDEIRAREEETMKETEALQRQTAWTVLPAWLRCLIVVGMVLASALALILLSPLPSDKKPFLPFTLSNKLSDLPGGTPLGLVQPLGWVCAALCAACSFIVVVFQVWCAVFVGTKTGENTPLIKHD